MQKLTFKHVTSVDSTSTLAMELWRSKELTPPFVVTADQQTQGRGQRGASWVSEPGNFFATLALPLQWQGEVSSKPGLLPLKAGLITAKVLRDRYRIPVLLKWPNDLFLHGCKLGGILTELQLDSNKQSEGVLFVGVGLNISHAPTITLETSGESFPTIALHELPISNMPPTLVEFRSDFLKAWCQEWDHTCFNHIIEQFGHVALQSGQPFKFASSDAASALWLEHSYEPDGRVTLAQYQPSPDESRPIVNYQSFSSASIKLEWLYHAGHRHNMPFIGMDVGNTRIKMRLYDLAHPGKSVASYSWRHHHMDELAVHLNSLKSELASRFATNVQDITCFPIFTSSVDPKAFEQVKEFMSSHADDCVLVPFLVPKTRLFSLGDYSLEQIGHDRLLMIEALAASYSNEIYDESMTDGMSVTMIVSAGTATTLDFVTSHGLHLGGLITSGISGGLKALGESGALLPAFSKGEKLSHVGGAGLQVRLADNTRDAMMQGILQPVVHLIEYWYRSQAGRHYLTEKINTFQKLHERQPVKLNEIRLVLTGGNAALIQGFFHEGRIIDDLVTLGVQAQILGELLQ